MRHSCLISWSAVAATSLALLSQPAAAAEPSAKGVIPERTDLDAVAREAVQKLLNGKVLHFSNEDDGGDRFEFLLTLALPAKKGGRYASHYLIARDKESVAVVILSPKADPFAYVTGGFMAGFDPTDPGSLVIYPEGNPTLKIMADPTNGNFETELSFSRNAEKPVVLVDLDSVLQTALVKIERASYDLRRKALHLTTKSSELLAVFPDDEQDRTTPVRSLVVKSRAGVLIAVSNVRVGGERSPLFGHDRAAFERLGVPTRVLGEREAPTVPLFVPPSFGSDERERRGIERVRTLFPDVSKLIFRPPARPTPPGVSGKESVQSPESAPALR